MCPALAQQIIGMCRKERSTEKLLIALHSSGNTVGVAATQVKTNNYVQIWGKSRRLG